MMAKTVQPAFVDIIRPDILECMLTYFCRYELIRFDIPLLPYLKGGLIVKGKVLKLTVIFKYNCWCMASMFIVGVQVY